MDPATLHLASEPDVAMGAMPLSRRDLLSRPPTTSPPRGPMQGGPDVGGAAVLASRLVRDRVSSLKAASIVMSWCDVDFPTAMRALASAQPAPASDPPAPTMSRERASCLALQAGGMSPAAAAIRCGLRIDAAPDRRVLMSRKASGKRRNPLNMRLDGSYAEDEELRGGPEYGFRTGITAP